MGNLGICSRRGTVELINYTKYHQQKPSYFLTALENNFYLCARPLQYHFGIVRRTLSTVTVQC